ncbi:hypothetical protein MVEN_01067200 [Mycena venus]|uniref:Uncharacterized protein n=1 Tax=Mycena venus TaxID=2733690 RepID=A0A8H7CZM8_9AGAR|nr:hypothetical protein MVEN_01067200 [Mycena venus]
MSGSVASSQTLSTQLEHKPASEFLPYDLVDLILGHTIGEVIHETVEMAFQGQSIPLSLFTSWNILGTLAGVSTTFRAIVLKLVALAFRIPLPCDSVFAEAYSQFRSLLLFKAATLRGAEMAPPVAWRSPLMQAYGYYFRTKFLVRGHQPSRRKSEILLALRLCNGAVDGLSRPLVDALNFQLREVVAAGGL